MQSLVPAKIGGRREHPYALYACEEMHDNFFAIKIGLIGLEGTMWPEQLRRAVHCILVVSKKSLIYVCGRSMGCHTSTVHTKR